MITLFHYYLPSFNILNAPRVTIRKIIAPIIKSGYFDWVNNTKTPAAITPVLIIISFDVKIMVAFMCASLLFDFCNK